MMNNRGYWQLMKNGFFHINLNANLNCGAAQKFGCSCRLTVVPAVYLSPPSSLLSIYNRWGPRTQANEILVPPTGDAREMPHLMQESKAKFFRFLLVSH